MKKYFAVSFKYSDSVFCSNIAHAETAEAVNAHYSNYEWVSVRECEDHEIETARRKGMPIVEIETAEAPGEVNEFETLAAEVSEDREKRAADTVFYIKNGFFPTWAQEHRTDPDRGLKAHSTAHRWAQYTAGEITREKAVELATKRATKDIEKKTAAKLAKLDRVKNAPDLVFISVSVDWVKSRTWGYNPRVEIRTNTGTFYGTASGCGYDKESAAIANALNQCDSVLKALYLLKEKGLCSGLSDKSPTACTGVDNRTVCGYGAGYSILPYFEGGVGTSCFWPILKSCGFKTSAHHTKHADFYEITKEVA